MHVHTFRRFIFIYIHKYVTEEYKKDNIVEMLFYNISQIDFHLHLPSLIDEYCELIAYPKFFVLYVYHGDFANRTALLPVFY